MITDIGREAAAPGGTTGFPRAAASWRLHEGQPPATYDAPVVRGFGWWAENDRHPSADASIPTVGMSVMSSELVESPPILVITDADSTLFEGEVIDELAAAAGVGTQVAEITASAMRGNLDFSSSLTTRVALLKGLPVRALEEVRAHLRVTPGGRDLIAWTHSVGARFAVVSGGFEEILAPLLANLGVDHLEANRLEVVDDALTGRVLGHIVDADAKRRAVIRWSCGMPRRAIAIGDGANDIAMLHAAGLGIAFCAKPAVKAAASSFLDIARLDAVVGLTGGSLEDPEGTLA